MSGVCWRGREIDAGTCVLHVSATALLFPLEKERQTLKRNARVSSTLRQVLDASNMSKQFSMNSTCNNAMCALCVVMECGSRQFSVFLGGGCYSHDLLLLDLSYSLRRSRENPFCIVRNLSRRRGSGGVLSSRFVFFRDDIRIFVDFHLRLCSEPQTQALECGRWTPISMQVACHVFVFITFKLSQQFIILNDREHHSSNAMSFWNCERCCAGAWAARGFDMPCPRLGNARPSSCRGNLIS